MMVRSERSRLSADVGPAGFEPATPRSLKRLYQPCAPWRCLAYNLTRLSHGPTFFVGGTLTRIKTFQILVCFSKVLRPRQVRRVSWSLGLKNVRFAWAC